MGYQTSPTHGRDQLMFFSKNRGPTLSSPKLGILYLGGEDTKQLVRSDASFLRPLFAELQVAEFACELGPLAFSQVLRLGH